MLHTAEEKNEHFRVLYAQARATLRLWQPTVRSEGLSKRAIEEGFLASWKARKGKAFGGRGQAFNDKLLTFVRHVYTDYDVYQKWFIGKFGGIGVRVWEAGAHDIIDPKILEAFPWMEGKLYRKLSQSR